MKIINFGQIVDLEHGTQISHQMTVEVPSGNRVQVRIYEDTVQQLVDAVTGSEETELQHTEPDQGLYELPDEVDPGEVQFSGESVFGAVGEEAVENANTPVPGLGNAPKPRARSVAKDELGYPIVQNTRGVMDLLEEEEEGDGTQI